MIDILMIDVKKKTITRVSIDLIQCKIIFCQHWLLWTKTKNRFNNSSCIKIIGIYENKDKWIDSNIFIDFRVMIIEAYPRWIRRILVVKIDE